MARLGEDFSGGVFRRLYFADVPAGLWLSLLAAVGLIVLHQGLQLLLAGVAVLWFLGGDLSNPRDFVKASLAVIFPASLIVAWAASMLARGRGGSPQSVLALRRPSLTAAGWVALVFGFMLIMYLAILAIVLAFGIDLSQYTPGPDGQSPQSGSAGLVKEAMFDIANEPLLFLLVLPSVAIGAPLAEEFIFRGQLFAALSQTRLGVAGATLVTAALWALMHATEPWLSVGLIFVMGLAFGYLMYRFGSLWVTIACHGAWNGIYALILFATLDKTA